MSNDFLQTTVIELTSSQPMGRLSWRVEEELILPEFLTKAAEGLIGWTM